MKAGALAGYLYTSGRNRFGIPVVSVSLLPGDSFINSKIDDGISYPCEPSCERMRQIPAQLKQSSDYYIRHCTSCGQYHLLIWLRDNVCLYATLESSDDTLTEFSTFVRQMYLKYLIHYLSRKTAGIRTIQVVGTDRQLLRTIELAYASANSPRPVMIYGETGTGKELWAQAIHLLSPRRTQPFLTINCAHLRDSNMAASRLFGHKRGAYTGAVDDRPGIFRKADGGTVFLDEIESLQQHAQEMLLRTIEYGEVQSLGTDSPVQVDVRIIAATNKQLNLLIKQGVIREDFYYRISTHQISLPPLRERTSRDIIALANYFLGKCNREHPRTKTWGRGTLGALTTYDWPGNVRELQNVVDSAFYTADMSESITRQHLPDQFRGKNPFSTKSGINQTDMIHELYHSLIEESDDFWERIHRPYLRGDLSRYQIQDLIELALMDHYTLQEVSRAFHIHQNQWRKFYLFLYRTIFRGNLPEPVSPG